MRKQICAMVLAILLAVTLVLSVFAAESENDRVSPILPVMESVSKMREEQSSASPILPGTHCDALPISPSTPPDFSPQAQPSVPSGEDSERQSIVASPSDAVVSWPEEDESDSTDGCEYMETEPVLLSEDFGISRLETLPFTARVEYSEDSGYVVLGSFLALPNDAVEIRPLFSTDGERYEEADSYMWDYAWELPSENADADRIETLQTQICIRGCDFPFRDYLRGEINTFWLKLRVETVEDGTYDTQSVRIKHDTASDLPPEPPAFAVEILKYGANGDCLFGIFNDFTPNIKTLFPIYSLDGEKFEPIMAGSEPMTWDLGLHTQGTGPLSLTHQVCSLPSMEPLCSYLNGTLDSFTLKLRVATWSGETYDTQPFCVSRELAPQPEDSRAVADWPASIRAKDGRLPPYYGKVQVTAREGMTSEELRALLPDTLPVEIQLVTSDWQTIDSGMFSCPIEWKLPNPLSLSVGREPVVICNAAQAIIPVGQEISMAAGDYRLTEGVEFSGGFTAEVRLSVNVLPKEAKAALALDDKEPGGADPLPLSLAFHQKPSGAAAIRCFYYCEGMEDWAEASELLMQMPVDEIPINPASEYYTLFAPEQAPYREYLAGTLPGFLVGIEIEGGVFDGELHTLRWPDAYETPNRVPVFTGSGGNRGDAGSDNNDGNSSENGGQRPGLPDMGDEESGATDNRQQSDLSDKNDSDPGGSSRKRQQLLEGLLRTEITLPEPSPETEILPSAEIPLLPETAMPSGKQSDKSDPSAGGTSISASESSPKEFPAMAEPVGQEVTLSIESEKLPVEEFLEPIPSSAQISEKPERKSSPPVSMLGMAVAVLFGCAATVAAALKKEGAYGSRILEKLRNFLKKLLGRP